MKKLRATYTRKHNDYDLSIDYTYEYEQGDYELPPSHELDVTALYINGVELPIDFFYEFVFYDIKDELYEHAQDNLN